MRPALYQSQSHTKVQENSVAHEHKCKHTKQSVIKSNFKMYKNNYAICRILFSDVLHLFLLWIICFNDGKM